MADYNPLRPEAGPIPYWKHHKRAKEALDFIIRILEGAASSVKEGKGIEGDESIDTNRASRIVFVSGEPGSGKSTLYLTLRAMLSSEKDYRGGYKGSFNLEKVRWLDPLDLEVAGDEGENLLAAVLVRLTETLTNRDDVSNTAYSKKCEDAIKDLEELATDIGIAWEGNLLARAGELDPDTYSEEVMRTQRARLRVNKRLNDALNDLAKNECYGCDSGTFFVLPVDDFYLKPDASLQLLRLLRMISIPRLFFLVMGDINTIEALFIEKSLADWTSVAGKELFVARPDRLGNAITRATDLRAHYLRKLLPPGQRASIEAMDWYEALDFRPSHNENSVETLEDLLEDVKLDASLKKPELETDSLHTFLISPSIFPPELKEEEKRKALIAAERLKREKRAKEGEASKEESNKEFKLKKHQSVYTALQVLDATPREVMDLYAALSEVKRRRIELNEAIQVGKEPEDKKKIPILLSTVRDIVNLVREEHSFLNEKQQKVLEQVLPTRVYSHEDINYAMDRLRLKPTQRIWNRKTEEQLWIRAHYTWDLTVIEDSDNEKTQLNKAGNSNHSNEGGEQDKEGSEQIFQDQFAKLPPRPAAWFVLLHDLAWNWSPDSITGNLVERLCEELNDWELFEDEDTEKTKRIPKDLNKRFFAISKIKLDPSDYFLGWAVWHEGEFYKHFPMPDFKTFQELDRFLYIWSRGIEWLKNPLEENEVAQFQKDDNLQNFLSVWALAGLTVIDKCKYKDFADNFAGKGDDWYKEKLKDFNYSSDNTDLQTWLDKVKDFPQKMNESSEESNSNSKDKPESTENQI